MSRCLWGREKKEGKETKTKPPLRSIDPFVQLRSDRTRKTKINEQNCETLLPST
jgi:hypothetical protein